MESMEMQETIVLYPAPEMGHIVSMVELGKKIVHYCNTQNSPISITIILMTGPFDTPSTTSYIHLISQTNPSISFHRQPPLPLDVPSPAWSSAAIAFHHFRQNATNAAHSLHQISKACVIRAFVIDILCTSSLRIGKDLGLPTYYFFTSGAAALAAFLFFPKIHQQTAKSLKDLPDTILQFPGLPSIKAIHMPEPCLDREDPAYDDMLYFCSHLPKSDGILVNTFDELEPKAIRTIASGVCVPDSPMPPVYYIGPLTVDGDDKARKGGDMDCLSWLETQPNRSVVFLCFGSRGSFSKAQVKEIAHGLETSGQRFLWVVKNPPAVEGSKEIRDIIDFDLESMLPEGFLERTKERGLVVKSWAPQVAILRREAVGGFVTHCGWNSVLEAVMAGVPMVAWPLYAEQHLNREFLVQDMKMAIPVEQREEDGFVTGDELGKRVKDLMSSEQGLELRQRSEKMKDKAHDALGEHGSSTGALAKLVKIWKEK